MVVEAVTVPGQEAEATSIRPRCGLCHSSQYSGHLLEQDNVRIQENVDEDHLFTRSVLYNHTSEDFTLKILHLDDVILLDVLRKVKDKRMVFEYSTVFLRFGSFRSVNLTPVVETVANVLGAVLTKYGGGTEIDPDTCSCGAGCVKGFRTFLRRTLEASSTFELTERAPELPASFVDVGYVTNNFSSVVLGEICLWGIQSADTVGLLPTIGRQQRFAR